MICLKLLYKHVKQYHRDQVRITVNISGKENYLKTCKKISHFEPDFYVVKSSYPESMSCVFSNCHQFMK